MEAVAASIRLSAPDVTVACAYLEHSTPDLAEACARLVASGIRYIRVVPMFLGVGRHAREDLPLLLDQLRANNPEVVYELRPAVGEDLRLVQLLAQLALDGQWM
jgi:sirohydrochlorin cobaltochelatase